MTNDQTVTQADRYAALKLLPMNTALELERAMDVRSGRRDGDAVVQAFARHRTAHSGEGRSNGAGEADPSKMSIEMADLFGLVCKLNRIKTERDDLMRTDGGFSVIERAADLMDEIVDAVPELQSAFGKVCERERQLLVALSAPQGEVERLREWQPIDTAPRDGTWFVACATEIGWRAMRIVRFRYDDDKLPTHGEGNAWPSAPTHWMPLPPYPAALAQPEAGGE